MSGALTIADGATSTITLESIGSFLPGDAVLSGIDGGILAVASVVSATQLSLHNASGLSVTIPAGTRLINVSRRPTIYLDALGGIPLGTFMLADSGGRATAYLPGAVYDYIISGSAPTVDATTTKTRIETETGATMSWNHTASGNDRLVIVAVAWQESLASETLDSVHYDSEPMTKLAGNNFLDMYYLVNPPTGSKTVLATWSGTGAKGAIGGATSFKGVNAATAVASPRATNGSTSPAAVTMPWALGSALVMDGIAVNTVPGTITATASTGQTSLWNLGAGSAPTFTRTLGAASYRTPSADAVTMSWALSTNRAWSALAVDVLPVWVFLHTAVKGAPCERMPFAIDASFYTGIQAAIDALPNSGGVVHLPSGTYREELGLIVNKVNVTLIGAGANTVITPLDPTNLPINLITVSAAQFRMSRLTLDGAAEEQDLDDGTCCLVYEGPGVSGRLVLHSFLESVVIRGASKYGIWFRDTILFTAIDCEVISNLGHGVRIQGTNTSDGASTTMNFMGCSISENLGLGAVIGDEPPPETGVISISFLSCTFEANQGEGTTLADVGTGVHVTYCPKVSLYSCYFEEAPAGAAQYVRFGGCPNAVVDNCWFEGGSNETFQPDRAVLFLTCSFARCSSNTAEGFKTEIIRFDEFCSDCVEMCNRDVDAISVARVTIAGGASIVGMSREALSIPYHAVPGGLPTGTDVVQGSLAWIEAPGGTDSQLQVWDGSAWKSIALV